LAVWNNEEMQSFKVAHYIQRATDFFEGMQLMKDDGSFQNSSALLAIHSAIAYTDALRAGLGDDELSADDHRKAIESLRLLLPSKRVQDQSGFQHLQYLISRKTSVAYGSQRQPAKYYATLVSKAVSFARWANEAGIKLKIEGWQHGDQ
jgi:hypothetical protein